MDKRIKQHRAESLKLSAALVVVADLEGLGSWQTSGPGCESGERRRGPRVPHGRDLGGLGVEMSVFWVKKEGMKAGGTSTRMLPEWFEIRTRNLHMRSCKRVSQAGDRKVVILNYYEFSLHSKAIS